MVMSNVPPWREARQERSGEQGTTLIVRCCCRQWLLITIRAADKYSPRTSFEHTFFVSRRVDETP